MNWHYLVLIGAVLIMFISMGNNPFEPPPGWVPPDEFKDGIKARLDGSNNGGFGGSGGFGAGGGVGGGFGQGFGGSTNGANTMGAYSGNMGSGVYKPSYGIGTAEGVGTYQPNATNPSLNNNTPSQDDRFRQMQNNQPTPNTNMPTPFQNMPGSAGPRSDASGLSFPGPYSYHTHHGAPVKFSGSSVFTLTKNGETIAMPDGEYNLEDGRTITVRGGKNMFPIGGNEFF